MPIELITNAFLEKFSPSKLSTYIVYGANPVLGDVHATSYAVFDMFPPATQSIEGESLANYQETINSPGAKPLSVGTVMLSTVINSNINIIHAVLPFLDTASFCYELTKENLINIGILKLQNENFLGIFSKRKFCVDKIILNNMITNLYFNIFENICSHSRITKNSDIQARVLINFFGAEEYGIDQDISAIALAKVINFYKEKYGDKFAIELYGANKEVYAIVQDSQYRFTEKELGIAPKTVSNIAESSSASNSGYLPPP